ncbi:hypothetical protein A0256_03635 [Mucilaginibacter sp. PAMC 26640]|nr:hypothetical protein A0256_03635 [Mucilaginibacter sp. PAMC 26640]
MSNLLNPTKPTTTGAISRKLAVLVFLASLLSVNNVKASLLLSITGKVVDEKGQSLPGATVFIAGSQSITACDISGNFHLDNLSPGSYVLTAKMMGFIPTTQAIILKDQSVKLSLKLMPNVNQLKGVTVRAQSNWADRYAIFKKHFLGTTPNAAECKVINPKILHFQYDKGTTVLSASAEDFLVIENNALGYRIKYLLTNFEYNESSQVLKYEGYPSFELLTSKSEKTSTYWRKNREAAYSGSIAHFIKAVYEGKPYAYGYEIFKVINRPMPGEESDPKKPPYFDRRPVALDSLVTMVDENFKTLRFNDCLFILNTHDRVAPELAASGYKIEKPEGYKLPNGQISVVRLLDTSVTIDANGNFANPGALFFEGYMAWEQVAELVPLEYNKE